MNIKYMHDDIIQECSFKQHFLVISLTTVYSTMQEAGMQTIQQLQEIDSDSHHLRE